MLEKYVLVCSKLCQCSALALSFSAVRASLQRLLCALADLCVFNKRKCFHFPQPCHQCYTARTPSPLENLERGGLKTNRTSPRHTKKPLRFPPERLSFIRHSLTSAHPLIITSANPLIITSANPLITTSAHPLIITSANPLITSSPLTLPATPPTASTPHPKSFPFPICRKSPAGKPRPSQSSRT